MSQKYPGGIISKTPVTPSGPYETSTASGIWTLDQQAYWRKLNQWPIAGSPVPDAQFNYVTMLLHGDGTNGAQNNTFVDSSTNNFTITRNGNTTQGSFSPYGSNWSNYFGGGTNLSLATATALGTGNVTVEFWFYPTDISATYYGLYDGRSAAGTNTGFGIFQYGQTIEIFGNGLKVSTAASAFTGNTWTHFAVVRTSGTCQIYINGVASGSSASYSDNFTSTIRTIASNVTTANVYTGYISNLREVTSALYSGTFTPSTTPLTAVSGTTLLTCQSNRFIDNSANNYAITITTITTGTPSVQRFNPFGASTAYSTSVIGGSGYFDGSGDYLGCGSQSAYAFGTGDFTLNVWVYLTSAPTYMSIADTRTSGWALAIDASRAIYLYSDAVGFVVTSAVGAVPFNAWTYVTVKRVSGTMTLYLNAVSINSAANSTNFSNTTLTIGANGSGGEPFFGYICDFQAIKGTGTTPTLPTAPLTNVTNTSLLLNYTNGAIFDNAMMNDLETVGNAQISTSVKKYGTGSMYFDGTGDYLKIPYSPNLQFGTGAYTLEFWLNTSSVSQWLVFNAENNSGIRLYVQSNGTLELDEQVANADNNIYSTATVNDGVWHHIALSRAGGAGTKMFVDGIYQSQQASAYNFNDSVPYYIGTRSNLSGFLTGYIDDLRITKGYARYTANFTPPTAAFPNIGPT